VRNDGGATPPNSPMPSMDCAHVVELLPWLANGSLSDAEARAVRAHLDGCASCRGERDEAALSARLFQQHVPAEALIALAFDRPIDGMSREVIDQHLHSCDTCAAELGLVRESRALLPAAEAPDQVRSGPQRGWAYLAAAAGLTMAVAASGWAIWSARRSADQIAAVTARYDQLAVENRALQESQQKQVDEVSRLTGQVARLNVPQVNAVAVDLFPVSLSERSGSERLNTLTIPDGASVTLLLHAPSAAAASEHEAIIVDAADRQLWSGAGLRRGAAGDYTLTLPAGFLAAGRYRIDIFRTDRGERRLVDRYALSVTIAPGARP
jgi:hypothetical protein